MEEAALQSPLRKDGVCLFFPRKSDAAAKPKVQWRRYAITDVGRCRWTPPDV